MEKASMFVPDIDFGPANDQWAEYDLTQPRVLFDGAETRYKAILKGSELVAILGKDYHLLPNEEALKIANSAAKLAGLQPFDPFQVPGIKHEGNVLYSENGHRIRAIYTTSKPAKVDGDEVNVGVNVFNAIDGSSSFGCGLFTFREICSNGVIYGYEKIMSVRRIHTKGMEAVVEDLKGRIVVVMEYGQTLVEKYRAMAAKKATEKMVDTILKTRIPARVLPEWIKEEELVMPDLSSWDLYNDVTEKIWKNEKAALRTKTFQFGQLHRAVDRWELA